MSRRDLDVCALMLHSSLRVKFVHLCSGHDIQNLTALSVSSPSVLPLPSSLLGPARYSSFLTFEVSIRVLCNDPNNFNSHRPLSLVLCLFLVQSRHFFPVRLSPRLAHERPASTSHLFPVCTQSVFSDRTCSLCVWTCFPAVRAQGGADQSGPKYGSGNQRPTGFAVALCRHVGWWQITMVVVVLQSARSRGCYRVQCITACLTHRGGDDDA